MAFSVTYGILPRAATYHDISQSLVEGSGVKLKPLIDPRPGFEVRVGIQLLGPVVLVGEVAGGGSTLGDDIVTILQHRDSVLGIKLEMTNEEMRNCFSPNPSSKIDKLADKLTLVNHSKC